MKWALSTLRQRHSTSREWQCIFVDHGVAFDAVFVSMVVWEVPVTTLGSEVKVKFWRNVVQFLSYLGGDDWVNRTQSPSSYCISQSSACTEEDHTYRVASPPLTRSSILYLTVIVLIISVRPGFTLLRALFALD